MPLLAQLYGESRLCTRGLGQTAEELLNRDGRNLAWWKVLQVSISAPALKTGRRLEIDTRILAIQPRLRLL